MIRRRCVASQTILSIPRVLDARFHLVIQTYNQLMKTAKAAYSEEKKAYDSRNVAESEVANVANAAAVAVRVILFALGSYLCLPLFTSEEPKAS